MTVFFNKKEEVLEIKLTSWGKELYSNGMTMLTAARLVMLIRGSMKLHEQRFRFTLHH